MRNLQEWSSTLLEDKIWLTLVNKSIGLEPAMKEYKKEANVQNQKF